MFVSNGAKDHRCCAPYIVSFNICSRKRSQPSSELYSFPKLYEEMIVTEEKASVASLVVTSIQSYTTDSINKMD
ncbi:hypothetical protein RB195_020756 [Necator americanus]|uniref:Uncharacterized protein n=1 Tax=Necator americanus TaxID=51031 RepID=A0ABR1CM07_NECAM